MTKLIVVFRSFAIALKNIYQCLHINEFVVNILEGAVFGKKGVGRPQLQYLKRVAKNTAADSYTAKKRMTCNNSRWKAANQSKD
jgi:hypothetical protein